MMPSKKPPPIETFVLEKDVLPPDMLLMPTGERQIAATLDRIAPDHRKRYEWAASRLGEGKRVLDAACGNGYGAYVLAEAGCKVHAVDCFANAIAFAIENYSHPNITYEVADLNEMALGEYDAIVSFETLEHLDAPVVVRRFHEAAPVLITSVPNENVMPFSQASHPFHHRHYTPEEFAELLSDYTIVGWYTQDDKWTGHIRAGDDGRTLIVVAAR